MTEAVNSILLEASRLSVEERADLSDRLVGILAGEMPEEIAESQLLEVRRRIQEVEAGTAELIPGNEALAKIRRLIAGAS